MSNFNDVTGDTLISKVATEEYKSNHDIIFANKVVVDPPSGWNYGFPAVWDKNEYETLAAFLRAKGYPDNDIEFAINYCNMWLPSEDDVT